MSAPAVARNAWFAVQAAAVPAIVIVAHQDIGMEALEIRLDGAGREAAPAARFEAGAAAGGVQWARP